MRSSSLVCLPFTFDPKILVLIINSQTGFERRDITLINAVMNNEVVRVGMFHVCHFAFAMTFYILIHEEPLFGRWRQ